MIKLINKILLVLLMIAVLLFILFLDLGDNDFSMILKGCICFIGLKVIIRIITKNLKIIYAIILMFLSIYVISSLAEPLSDFRVKMKNRQQAIEYINGLNLTDAEKKELNYEFLKEDIYSIMIDGVVRHARYSNQQKSKSIIREFSDIGFVDYTDYTKPIKYYGEGYTVEHIFDGRYNWIIYNINGNKEIVKIRKDFDSIDNYYYYLTIIIIVVEIIIINIVNCIFIFFYVYKKE